MSRFLLLILLGLSLTACYMDRTYIPEILINGQMRDRYQARVGEKIEVTAMMSGIQLSDNSRKPYAILYNLDIENNTDCFNLKENPVTPLYRRFCPTIARFFKGITPEMAPNSPAKTVPLTFDARTSQWVSRFEIEAVEICSDVAEYSELSCPSTWVAFYSAPVDDPKTIAPFPGPAPHNQPRFIYIVVKP